MKKVAFLVLISISSVLGGKNCLLLKDQKCEVKKVIIDNDYMTFPYEIGVNRCVRSCNDKDNPYFKVCLPDSGKNISVNVFHLKKNILKKT